MPLKVPGRLPKRFNRVAGTATRSLARRTYAGQERIRRRRHERMARWSRRAVRIGNTIASEFRVWLIMATGGIAIALAAVLLFAPFFDVRTIHIRRQDARIDPEEVQETLSPLFRQRLVLVTRAQVSALLQSQYIDIERVEILKEYPSTLNVTIFTDPVMATITIDESGAPEAQGSGGLLPAANTGASLQLYVTTRGYFVTSPVPLSAAPLEQLTVTDWSMRPQNRTRFLSPEFLQTVFHARDTLRRDFGLESTEITLFIRAQEFHIRTEKGTLWFDAQSPLSMQFQRLREFLKTVSFDQVKSYVDLRIADKVIYK
jgi:hypothetical protein